jgi:hypothetical protein
MVSAPVFSALIGMCFLGLSSGSASLVLAFFVPATIVSLKTILSSMQVIIAAAAGGVCVYVYYWLNLLLGMLRALNSYHQQTNHSDSCVLLCSIYKENALAGLLGKSVMLLL